MTPTQREAMEAAIDAMASVIIDYQTGKSEVKAYSIAHAGLRAALTEPTPVQEPVAWAIFTDAGNARMWTTFQPHIQKLADSEGLTVTPLYTAQPSKEQP